MHAMKVQSYDTLLMMEPVSAFFYNNKAAAAAAAEFCEASKFSSYSWPTNSFLHHYLLTPYIQIRTST